MMLRLPTKDPARPIVAINTARILTAHRYGNKDDFTSVTMADGRVTIFAITLEAFVRCVNDLERTR